LLPEGEATIPILQPAVQLPADELIADEAEATMPPLIAPPPPLTGAGATRAGQPPLATVQPVPGSVEQQVLLGTPLLTGDAAEGVVQANPGRILGDSAPWLTGLAVSAVRGLDYSFELRTEYNDNYRRVRATEGDDAGPSSEWRFTPEATIAAGHNLGRHLLFANATFGWDFHARNTDRDRERVNLNGGVQWVLGSRCGGRIQGGYSTRQSTDLLDELGALRSSAQNDVDATLSAACRLAGRLTGTFAYDWSKHTYSEEIRQIGNRREDGFVGGLSYPIGSRGSLSASGFLRNSIRPNQLLLTGEKNKQKYKGFSVGGGYSFGPSIGVNGSIGKTWVTSRNPLATSFSGISWSVGATYGGPRLGASVGASRSASSGGGGAANLSVSRQLNANLSYKANQRMTMTAGYLRSKTEYRELLILPGIEWQRPERTTESLFAGTDFRINRMISTSLEYRHRTNNTDTAFGQGALRDYSANLVTFTIRAGF